jgi:hypothetical protein
MPTTKFNFFLNIVTTISLQNLIGNLPTPNLINKVGAKRQFRARSIGVKMILFINSQNSGKSNKERD